MMRWILTLLGVDDLPDPAWKPTGIRHTSTGHDEALAAQTAKHRDEVAEMRRKIEARRAKPTQVP
jgi:hypothetical protein